MDALILFFSLLFRPVYFFLCSKTLPLRARPPKRGGFRPVCLLTCPFFFSKSRRSDAPGKGHDFHLFLCVHVCIETIFYKKQIMIGTICQQTSQYLTLQAQRKSMPSPKALRIAPRQRGIKEKRYIKS